VRVILPFKDEISANVVKRQMRDLSHMISTTLQPVFTSRKLEQDLKPREIKHPILNQQCLVYSFKSDLWDSDCLLCSSTAHGDLKEHPSIAFSVFKHFLSFTL